MSNDTIVIRTARPRKIDLEPLRNGYLTFDMLPPGPAIEYDEVVMSMEKYLEWKDDGS